MNKAEYNQIRDYLYLAAQTKYSAQDIKARFETEQAASYGEGMARWIPDFEYAHQLLLSALATSAEPIARGVELGAGSGRVSKLLLDAFPSLNLTLVDISPNMLGVAKERLAADTARCEFQVHDIFAEDLEFPANSLDCIVSVFAICHAQSVEIYKQLYRRIYKWLRPGGSFFCYDHVRGDTFEWTALNAMGWHQLLMASQTAEQAKEGIVGTYQEDSPLSLREHLALLTEAGFSAADVLYKRDIFAIYAGTKSG